MADRIKTSELVSSDIKEVKDFLAKHEYPWEILPDIKDFVVDFASKKHLTEIYSGVFVGENVKISNTATILGPTVILDNCEIRPGAYIRGNAFICDGCVIGNSSEIKNSLILSKAQIPHYNYVGDSVIGVHAHMGAGSICSNLKSLGKTVTVHGESDYETGLRKVGAILADGADIGCGCVLNPGTIVGKNTTVYPLLSLRGVYPENSVVKTPENIVKKV